ncbi:MAG: thiamine ABC transporter substrate-binding protein [Actinobacteria bacterium]|nr:thiamine ABC transporter substrate-binding protein [Actinomycetota bacterium]
MRRAAVTVVLATLGLASTLLSACGSGGGDGNTLTLVTHDSFAVSDDVFAEFTEQTGVEVEVLPSGDAGAAINQVILTKDDPLGDVFFGLDNTFLTRATEEGVFARYESPELAAVPDQYELDPRHRVTPIDRGDVCINYDKAYFADNGLPVPQTLDDLTRPEYRGLLVTENPATSSPGLAFLLATVAQFGEDGWRDYWERLRANDVQVVAGWEEAYNGEFSAGEGQGDQPLVVSYASSPPAAVFFSDPQPAESPIGTVLASCFNQIEFAGVLEGTDNERAARELVDFMLSERFQEDIPLNMFVFPVRDGVLLPDVFVQFAEVPPEPLTLDPDEIGDNRDRWIEEWTDTVLR